jgi:hypothetical protein
MCVVEKYIESRTELFNRRTIPGMILAVGFILTSFLWVTLVVGFFLLVMGLFFAFLPLANWRAKRRRGRVL